MHHGHRRTRTQRRATSAHNRPSYWTTPAPSTTHPLQQDLTRLARATISPLFFARTYLDFHPEPAQAHVLRNAHFAKRIVLNCNRQWGKSTIAAILIAHRLFTIPNSLVLIVAPAGRQSGEVALKIKSFLYDLNLELTSDGINPNSIVLPNGSRLVTLPAVNGTARGYSAVSMLLFDEASRIKNRIYLAFRPMLAVAQGDLILVSTPNGKRGFFYREMAGQGHDSNVWFRHTGPVTECIPRISAKVVEEEKAKGDAYFRPEWLCEFIETGIYAIDEETIHKLIKHEIEAYKWI